MKKRSRNKSATANPLLAKGLADLAYSNAAGTHKDKRTKRNRTRQTKDTTAIKDFE